jgi:phosphatidylserine/phosphatidylglycerophosphate/cardiolipin synthase-like enzyme
MRLTCRSMFWEQHSEAARKLGAGIEAAAGNLGRNGKLLVRIIVDDNSLDRTRVIDRLRDSVNSWKIDRSKVTVQLATYPSVTGNLHEKLVIVDGRYLGLTGANPEMVHDRPTPWHDTGYHIQGPIVQATLHAFDAMWRDEAKHWRCAKDCEGVDRPARPDRSGWFKEPQVGGSYPVVAMTRKGQGGFGNDVSNPQDQGFMALMAAARSELLIESPNINDDHFSGSVVATALRRVPTTIITSYGFNGSTNSLVGGTNEVAVRKLRQSLAALRGDQANLSVCWYSRDGLEPLIGNASPNSHAKFMSVDRTAVVLGTANMDTWSWNHSREYNILVDGPTAAGSITQQVFDADRKTSICSLVELYENENAQGEFQCVVPLTLRLNVHADDKYDCEQDEARSLLLQQAKAGTVIRLFNDGQQDRSEAWSEITIKRDVAAAVISGFEKPVDNEKYGLVVKRSGELTGKVSSMQICVAGESCP